MMPLSMAPVQQDCCLVEIQGGEQVKRRLEALGLTPGACLSIVSSQAGQPLILAVKRTRLALGRGVAQKIIVSLSLEDGEVIPHGNNV